MDRPTRGQAPFSSRVGPLCPRGPREPCFSKCVVCQACGEGGGGGATWRKYFTLKVRPGPPHPGHRGGLVACGWDQTSAVFVMCQPLQPTVPLGHPAKENWAELSPRMVEFEMEPTKGSRLVDHHYIHSHVTRAGLAHSCCTQAMRGPPLLRCLTGIEPATYSLSNCSSDD